MFRLFFFRSLNTRLVQFLTPPRFFFLIQIFPNEITPSSTAAATAATAAAAAAAAAAAVNEEVEVVKN